LDSLIPKGDLKLSEVAIEEVKNRIVLKLGEVASKKGGESAPVVCNSHSIVFDEDVKQVLREVVQEEVQSLRSDPNNAPATATKQR
ncbi:unnamed protein product, partial [Ectocarpus fasciculatus]